MAKPKKTEYCENHPNVEASDTCAYCSKRICPQCRKETFGRSFCSGSCTRHYVIHRVKSAFLTLPETIGNAFLDHPIRNTTTIIIAAILIFFVIKYNQLNRQMHFLSDQTSFSQKMIVGADTSLLPTGEIIQPVKGGMVTQNQIDIGGRAEENWILSLAIDGHLERVTLPKDGRFAFDDVLLHRGENQIEVRAINPEGEVHILQTLTLNYGPPMLGYLSRGLYRGPLDRKEIALTFDGGAEDNVADEILDLLKDSGVKATFFLTGEFIRNYPKTVQRIANEGHVVGNHTWNHPHLTTYADNFRQETLPDMSGAKIRQELVKTAELYKRVTGKEMFHIWRAPYGEYNQEILNWAAQAGYRHVGWTTGRGWQESMDTMDWVADKTSKAYHTSEEIFKKVMDFAKKSGSGANGAIILMHLGSQRSDDFPHLKLPEMISSLRNKGYSLVTLEEMMNQE